MNNVETQLAEVKAQLEKVLDRLDALVVLEVQHTNTVVEVTRCHDRVDKLEERVTELSREVSSNSFITKAGERLTWLVITALVGAAAYMLR